MAHRSSNAHPARRTEPDAAASADDAVDPYDTAYIFRSIFGSEMKGHWQTWPFIDADYAAWIDRVVSASTEPALFRPGARDRVLVCCTCANNPDPTKDFDMFAVLAVIG